MLTLSPTFRLKAIDFFCSAGGVTCGLRQAGIQVLGGIDVDKSCKETYESNNLGSKFISADISKYTFEELINDFNVTPNDDDLLFVGCSPCQYYSIINTSRDKSTKSRLLLEDFRKFIDHFNPGYVLIENVPGLRNIKKASPLSNFKEFLITKGYKFDERVVNAYHYGVPQNRKRYVLMASRCNEKISIPEPQYSNTLTVRKAIGLDKGYYPIVSGYHDTTSFKHSCQNLSETNKKRLKKTPHDGGLRLAWKDDPELQLKCYIGKDSQFVDTYGRMHWDLPSPTITTKFYSISNGRFAHPEQDRAISLREGATLQSFPVNYIFHSNNIASVARMIGNAVPPALAKALGLAFLKNRHYATI